ncbi:MAG: SPOR domain-containing protein [Paracoccus sp. (in: a-proteobacteria)]|nr:SPOR domain-containing protein [Paracoccus sp. (in: a-proteobacteria)]
MRVFLFVMLSAVAARAELRPAELPPDDFAAGQYIDSRGCVFRRNGTVWSAVMLDDAQVCGYPPSFGAADAGAIAPRTQLSAPALEQIEQELLVAVASGGDLEGAEGWAVAAAPSAGATAAAPQPQRPAATVPPQDAATASRGPSIPEDLSRAVAAAPALQGATRSGRNSQMCELMGLGPADGSAIDATGECGAALMRRPVPTTNAGAARTQAAAPASAAPAAPVARVEPAGRPAAAGPQRNAAQPPSRSAPIRPTRNPAEMVPDGARYVHLGRFAEPEAVARAISDLTGMGYRALASRSAEDDAPRLVVAGPFETRERLVSALDHIRRAGYPAARAR